MQARLLHLHFQTYDKLLRLKKEAEADGLTVWQNAFMPSRLTTMA